MLKTKAYAAMSASSPLVPHEIARREPGPNDVLIKILYCGICHSDIHSARNEWRGSQFPLVPGHEIVGRVVTVGARVKKFKKGDMAGVGCFVDSCRRCDNCKNGEESYCDKLPNFTYNHFEKDGKTRTYGGYSSQIVVDENYVLKIPPKLPPAAAAPLLCAGITTYSPLKHFGVKRGQNVGVVGLGGLGHMAVKLAASMGANVTVFSSSEEKEKDALRFGAKRFVINTPNTIEPLQKQFHFILNTVSVRHPVDGLLSLLRLDGVMVLVGAPEYPLEFEPFSLIGRRRRLAGSLIGGIRETQEMLDYCAQKKIAPEIEVIPIQNVNEAYDRTVNGDVRYRFVIDLNTLV